MSVNCDLALDLVQAGWVVLAPLGHLPWDGEGRGPSMESEVTS